MASQSDRAVWQTRAAAAEFAVLDRFVTRMPGLAWGRSRWPAHPPLRRRPGDPPRWHYWWSAHHLDAAVDAAHHRPTAGRRRRTAALARGILVRNHGTWKRPFWDDLAWLGLAFERAGDLAGRERVALTIARRLEDAIDPAVGAIPWRVGSPLFNAPANGPAAILLARVGRTEASLQLTEWIHEHLTDDSTGLVLDGIEVTGHRIRPVTSLYTYCQGVALGAYAAAPGERFRDAAVELVAAVTRWTAPDHVLPGSGGGDGGLFAGITCRYLAAAVPHLPDEAATAARRIVLAGADAAWRGAARIEGRPLFATDWRAPADDAPEAAERDLSVQLGGWLAMEAAVAVTS